MIYIIFDSISHWLSPVWFNHFFTGSNSRPASQRSRETLRKVSSMLFISTPTTAKKIDKSRLGELDSSTLVDLIKVCLLNTWLWIAIYFIKVGCIQEEGLILNWRFILGLYEWKSRFAQRKPRNILSKGHASEGPRARVQGKWTVVEKIRGGQHVRHNILI